MLLHCSADAASRGSPSFGAQKLFEDARRSRNAAAAVAAKLEQKRLVEQLFKAQLEISRITSSFDQHYADEKEAKLKEQEQQCDALVKYTLSLSAGPVWLAVSFLPDVLLSDRTLRAIAREQQRRK